VADPLSFLGAGSPGAKRVSRTGIALVHENEIIYPAAGSEAQAVQALEDSRTRIDVYFPIEIEIREASASGSRRSDVPADPLAALDAAMARR
jgi:hypothetical protein